MDEYLIVSGEQDFSEFVVEIGLCPKETRVRSSVHPDDLQVEARHLPHTAAAPCLLRHIASPPSKWKPLPGCGGAR